MPRHPKVDRPARDERVSKDDSKDRREKEKYKRKSSSDSSSSSRSRSRSRENSRDRYTRLTRNKKYPKTQQDLRHKKERVTNSPRSSYSSYETSSRSPSSSSYSDRSTPDNVRFRDPVKEKLRRRPRVPKREALEVLVGHAGPKKTRASSRRAAASPPSTLSRSRRTTRAATLSPKLLRPLDMAETCTETSASSPGPSTRASGRLCRTTSTTCSRGPSLSS